MTAARRDILLLKDYRNHFYSSVRSPRASMRIDALAAAFAERGVTLRAMSFGELDLRAHCYQDEVVLYQSSEDRDLLYKSFIEDLILALSLQGARLVPAFPLLRAHHNKVFMELLRDLSGWPKLQNIRSRAFGTLEEFLVAPVAQHDTPLVLKSAEGCQSQGVMLAQDRAQARRAAARLSSSPHSVDDAKDLVKRVIRPGHTKVSRHRRKFVVQELVPALTHDFKVIPCGERVYVLKRRVAANDFRASGSGLWEWVEAPMPALLDFAVEVERFFDVPYVSLDIAERDGQFYVFEFQFLMFGTTTIEKATWYFEKCAGTWMRVEEVIVLEKVIADSVIRYVDAKWPT